MDPHFPLARLVQAIKKRRGESKAPMLRQDAAGLVATDASTFSCTCCGYHGHFESFGPRKRPNALCPECGALERHRLFAIANRRHGIVSTDARVLHFAPEPAVTRQLSEVAELVTVDLTPGRADRVEDIECLSFPDASFTVAICFHVLEHVDDRSALRELHRVLRPGGLLLCMVPIIEAWATTYEDASITSPRERERHFGQADHVRYYGRDFRERITAAGFALHEYVADGADSVRYGLVRGETLFVGTRPS